jgi:rare lipoprotein A
VRNPKNGNEVIVRVADRGPHSRNRIIDLSYGAAEKLGIVSRGVAMVEVEPLEKTIIPMKPPTDEIPELELEVTDNSFHSIPEWQDMTHSHQRLPEKVNKNVKKKNSVTNKNEKEKK